MADRKNNNGATKTALIVGVVAIGVYVATILLNG
jgi:hypothetical protein|tara:strand:- start:406 stop:507 length:102 start_codon:yes stop_codon:yes gene_type:complete